MGDPERYRNSEEIERMRKDDPIALYRSQLVAGGHFDAQALEQEDAGVEKEILAAIEFAESSPEPGPADLYTDIYTES